MGIGSPRASLEANYALRALVGPGSFFRGMSDTDDRLVGAVLEIAADPRLRLGSAADVHGADAVLVLGEDLTNTAPMLDLTIRTWLHLRPNEVEERNHIRRWNDAGITRIKRREPSALWIATTHATKLDEVAAETRRAAPDDLVRLALALAHEIDAEAPAVPGLGDDEAEVVRRWAASLTAGSAPLVVAGCSSGSAELLRAAAQLAAALRRAARGESAAAERATLVLTVPEPDSVGLRMLGGGTLVQALAAVARGESEVVVVLDDDLDRRAPALLVDDLLRRDVPVVALAALEDRLTAAAAVVLPAATFAEETGTWVSHEGRAQRYFAALPPADGVRPSWRWLRELLVRLGRREARGWTTPDDVLAALEMELPAFRGAGAAAPAASWRRDGRKVARQPLRWSGRTAVDADRTVFEPGPAPDADSALAFSLEGLQPPQSPDGAPRPHLVAGLELGQRPAQVRRGARGRRPGAGRPASACSTAPPATSCRRSRRRRGSRRATARWCSSRCTTSTAPSSSACTRRASAERAPAPFIGLNEEDAERLEVRDGDLLELWLPWMDARAPFALVPSLVTGTAGVPVGLPGLPYISLPARARLTRAEEQ